MQSSSSARRSSVVGAGQDSIFSLPVLWIGFPSRCAVYIPCFFDSSSRPRRSSPAFAICLLIPYSTVHITPRRPAYSIRTFIYTPSDYARRPQRRRPRSFTSVSFPYSFFMLSLSYPLFGVRLAAPGYPYTRTSLLLLLFTYSPPGFIIILSAGGLWGAVNFGGLDFVCCRTMKFNLVPC